MFVIALVISLPFYSANTLALSVQITKNQGEAGIEGFLDAEGDSWTVNALISGSNGTINSENVKMKIGQNEDNFNSCTDSPMGVVCEYLSPLTDGVNEQKYGFSVVYRYQNELEEWLSSSNGDYVYADGSAPLVTFTSLTQKGGKLLLDFNVRDDRKSGGVGVPAVGIKTVTITDGETGAVLQTISGFEQGVTDYTYSADERYNSELQATLEGAGRRSIKIYAEDWLGHKSGAATLSLDTDFIAPDIQNYLNLSSIGQFIGDYTLTSDVQVKIIEDSDDGLKSVKGYSEQLGLEGQPANDCSDDDIKGTYICTWDNIEINPESSISLRVVAEDIVGNVVEKTVSTTLVKDVSAPMIEFFGTDRLFEGKSYITSQPSNITLRINEQGAGMDIYGIVADLSALGKGQYEIPLDCEQTPTTFNCNWNVNEDFTSDGVARIRLNKFQDKMKNVGEMPETEIYVDNTGPKVESMEMYGLSDVGEKDYFQSNDKIKFKIKVTEMSGVTILLNLKNVVMDAENMFPPSAYENHLGWMVVTESSCSRGDAGSWVCEFETPEIKSGPETGVGMEIKIQDTAGNNAVEWVQRVKNAQSFQGVKDDAAEFTFDLLGLSTEENPDYWQVPLNYPIANGFVDIDTTDLFPTRMLFDVQLESTNSQAKVISIELPEGACTAAEGSTAPELSRAMIYGGNFVEGSSEPDFKVLLEIKPFDGKSFFDVKKNVEISADYVCKLTVYTKVGENALQNAEMQEVAVHVPFAFSSLGALDESLADKIREIKYSGFMKFARVISWLNTAFVWLKWIAGFLNIIVSVDQIINIATTSATFAADETENTGVLAGIGASLRGACVGGQASSTSTWSTVVRWISLPMKILTCDPKAFNFGDDNFYTWWQTGVLTTYNFASFRTVLGIPANNLYENIYVASAGLCLPGIVYNINKARELECRKIVCYGVEVPAGITTIDACNQLHKLQMCEFFYGPLLDFFLFGGVADIGAAVQRMMSSPLGLITISEIAMCTPLCFVKEQEGLLIACKVTAVLNRAIGMVDSVVGLIVYAPWKVKPTHYCDLAYKIDLDKLGGGASDPVLEESIKSTDLANEQQEESIKSNTAAK